MIQVTSPGKLILSGEHAVVYGAPACALAVNKTIEGKYQCRTDDNIILRSTSFEKTIKLSTLELCHQELSYRYLLFTQNTLLINQVLRDPVELCWFAIAQVLIEAKAFSSLQNKHTGIEITLETNIPIGCGMGSSAALIVNIILGINALFQLNLSPEKIYALALVTENLQHGRSSGLDIKLSLMGGIHSFQRHQLTPFFLANTNNSASLPLQYFNSGKPESSTGECVAFVKQQNFSTTLWQEFEKTTKNFVLALQENNQKNLITTIKKNHRLLCEIGVVPQAIQKIIAAIEDQGGAAKICGAGSIRGDNAGMILMTNNVTWPNATPLHNIHTGARVK